MRAQRRGAAHELDALDVAQPEVVEQRHDDAALHRSKRCSPQRRAFAAIQSSATCTM